MNAKFASVVAFFFSFFYFGNKHPDIPLIGIIIISTIVGAAQFLIFGNREGGTSDADKTIDEMQEDYLMKDDIADFNNTEPDEKLILIENDMIYCKGCKWRGERIELHSKPVSPDKYVYCPDCGATFVKATP